MNIRYLFSSEGVLEIMMLTEFIPPEKNAPKRKNYGPCFASLEQAPHT